MMMCLCIKKSGKDNYIFARSGKIIRFYWFYNALYGYCQQNNGFRMHKTGPRAVCLAPRQVRFPQKYWIEYAEKRRLSHDNLNLPLLNLKFDTIKSSAKIMHLYSKNTIVR
jgi:hypothetical protein